MTHQTKIFAHLDYVKAPKVHWQFATKRVLTVEFYEGSKVNDLDYIHRHAINVDDVRDIAALYSDLYAY